MKNHFSWCEAIESLYLCAKEKKRKENVMLLLSLMLCLKPKRFKTEKDWWSNQSCVEKKKEIEHEDFLRKPEKYLCENKQQQKKFFTDTNFKLIENQTFQKT